MKEVDNIDDYLLGLLSEADERAFLERVAQDQALAQQLAQRQKLIRGIQHKGRRALKAELEAFHQQHQPQAASPRTPRLLPWLAAAAAAVIMRQRRRSPPTTAGTRIPKSDQQTSSSLSRYLLFHKYAHKPLKTTFEIIIVSVP